MATILTIGEFLWDILPEGRHLGGAPANVAFHLAQIGHQAQPVSAVGDDELGERAIEIMRRGGVDTTLVTEDPVHPTGVVRVELDADGVPTFDITPEVAWDFIPTSAGLLAAVTGADAIVFGTLAQRHPRSRATIAAALDAAPADGTRVLDLNLRPPFYDGEIVAASIEHATILKLSEEEMRLLPGLLGMPDDADFLPRLAARHALARIYVTRGARGCEVFAEGETTSAPATPVRVADTVGAGDAFTAGLIDGELRELETATIAANACAAGAFVASRSGATPSWTGELRETLGLEPR